MHMTGKSFIFRGLIKCADCGCTITPEKTKGHIYYSCTNYKGFHAKALNSLRQEYDKIKRRTSRSFDLRIDDKSITEEMFSNKLKEYKEKQAEIETKMQQYTEADKSFYITANTILSLAQRAYEIFQNSETQEKRQILNFVV